MKLLKDNVNFGEYGEGSLFEFIYPTSSDVLGIVGYLKNGEVMGKLSVNIPIPLKKDEFIVKLYGEGLIMNDLCFETGLFQKIGEPFTIPNSYGNFQIWKLLRKES